jgi:hypothetical protein
MAVKPSRTGAALMAATWSGIIAAATAACACHKYEYASGSVSSLFSQINSNVRIAGKHLSGVPDWSEQQMVLRSGASHVTVRFSGR